MTAGDDHAADPFNALHHEWQDNRVYGHHVYKSVWSPIIGEQFIQGITLPANPHHEFPVKVIKESYIVGSIL